MNTTAAFLPLVIRGIREVYDLETSRQEKFSDYIVGKSLSTTFLEEKMALFAGLGPAADLLESGKVPYDDPQLPFTYTLRPRIKAIGMRNSVLLSQTDQTGRTRQFARMAAKSQWLADQMAAADVFNYCTDTGARWLLPDGKPFAAVDHVRYGGATGANTWSSPRSLGPNNLDDALIAIRAQKAFRDDPWVYAGQFKLITALRWESVAFRLYQTVQVVGSGDNDKAFGRTRIAGYQCNPFITMEGFWGLIPAEDAANPIVRLSRGENIMRSTWDPQTLDDMWVSWKCYAYGVLWHQGTWLSPLTV